MSGKDTAAFDPAETMNPDDPRYSINAREEPLPATSSIVPSPAAPNVNMTPVTRFVMLERAVGGHEYIVR